MSEERNDPKIPLGSPRQRIRDEQLPPGLAPDSVVHLDDVDEIDTDVLVIGSGMGSGTLAYALRESGAKVLVVERGGSSRTSPRTAGPSRCT